MHAFIRYATEKQAEIVQLIKEMAECESPSDSPAEVNQFINLVVERTKDIAVPQTIPSERYGKHLRLEFKPAGPEKKGTDFRAGAFGYGVAAGNSEHHASPSSMRGGLWGPGVLDMKAGLAVFIYAVRLLRELDTAVARKVVLLIVSDEEVGSETSRAVTEAEAKHSDFVLVVEPGTGLTGKLKTARKGVGNYTVSIEGRASHAGVDFSSGASAILEAARQIERIAGFTNLKRGITVNPGVISGGTRTNVVAAEARIEVDIRVVRLKDAEYLDKKFRALRPVDKRCRIFVQGGLNRPPMERTRAIRKLFAKAKKMGFELGVDIQESSTGGGSDGNFTAGLGVPTLDGLGAVGEGAHAVNESILIDQIPERVALLAMLIAEL
jgi:glutamate carboxypeptidase